MIQDKDDEAQIIAMKMARERPRIPERDCAHRWFVNWPGTKRRCPLCGRKEHLIVWLERLTGLEWWRKIK